MKLKILSILLFVAALNGSPAQIIGLTAADKVSGPVPMTKEQREAYLKTSKGIQEATNSHFVKAFSEDVKALKNFNSKDLNSLKALVDDYTIPFIKQYAHGDSDFTPLFKANGPNNLQQLFDGIITAVINVTAICLPSTLNPKKDCTQSKYFEEAKPNITKLEKDKKTLYSILDSLEKAKFTLFPNDKAQARQLANLLIGRMIMAIDKVSKAFQGTIVETNLKKNK